MRLLHTSDWHLGVNIEKASCHDEQARFLDWLIDELRARATDVLVVSGDVFHYRSPSNTAEQLYFDFLVDCARIETLRKVVIVAGNHDSPSKLEAPREVLEVLDVHVVGDMPPDDQLERCLHPVCDDADEITGVVAAIPYVRDAYLGLTVRDTTPAERRQTYVEAFDELYSDVAHLAREQWPDVPLVATGHLTCYAPDDDAESGDFDTAIHGADPRREETAAGHIKPLGPAVFDDAYDYVALGHLHRPNRVGRSDARYSGTPVPTKLDEARTQRHVVDVHWPDGGGEPDVEWVDVPLWRDIREITGSPDEVLDQIDQLAYDELFAPYLYLEVELGEDDTASEVLTEAQNLLDERFDSGARPGIVDDRYFDASAGEGADGSQHGASLKDLDPVDVFRRKFQRDRQTDEQPPDELLEAFRQLQNRAREDG